MEIEIQSRPSYSYAFVRLKPGERIRAEAGALIGMSDGVSIETKAEGGIFKSITRNLSGSESFLQNFYQAGTHGGEITLAPNLPGDMTVVEVISGKTLMIQSGAYVASETSVELNARVSLKAFMAAEGVSMLEATGFGKVVIATYGAICERALEVGQKYIVDSAHLVAFDANVNAEPRMVGGLKSSMFSGEGVVIELSGPGRIWMQTRSPRALIGWIIPQLPKQSASDS